MLRQKAEPVILADTSRLTFSERLEYQKLGIMADDLPTIYLNDRMEKAEYDSVLGLFVRRKPLARRVVQRKACADDVDKKTPFARIKGAVSQLHQ